MREKLLQLRQLIFEVAEATDGAWPLTETLKWGQPSYLPATPKIGTTIRIDALKDDPNGYALFVNCQTSLIEDFQTHYPREFGYQGKRAVILTDALPGGMDAIRHCIALALTYHRRKKRA